MNEREELQQLRRLAQLEAKAASTVAPAVQPQAAMRADIPELRPYTEKPRGLAQQIRESKFVTEAIGPTENQKLRMAAERAKAEQMFGVSLNRPNLAQQMGTAPALLKTAAQAVAGPDMGQMLKPEEGAASTAAALGAMKGQQMGAPLGLYGRIGGAALGGASAYGAERLRQFVADDRAPATAGELAQVAVNSPMIAQSQLASRAVNAAVQSLASGAQAMTAQQAKRLIDQGEALGVMEAANDSALSFGVGAAAGFLSPGSSAIRPMDITANKLKDSGWLIPKGVSKQGQNLASLKNFKKAEDVLVSANGLSNPSELNEATLKSKAAEIYRAGYEPIKKVQMMSSDKAFRQSINDIDQDFRAAQKAAPGVLKDEISDQLKGLRNIHIFDGDGALALISGLRAESKRLFKQDSNKAATGLLKAASAVEELVERNLSGRGKDGQAMLDSFKKARTQFAINYATQEGLRRGGSLIPKHFANLLQDGVPLSGGLEQIGELANNFPQFSKDPTKINTGISALKQFLVTPATIAGYAKYNIPGAIAGAALPYVPTAYNYAAITKPFQAAMDPRISPQMAQQINLFARQRETANK